MPERYPKDATVRTAQLDRDETDHADLPAKLAFRPVVVVDTREQDPLPLRRLPTIRAGLQSGDYSLAGAEHMFAVERKSIPDLVGSVSGERDRFERELHRLRGFRFSRFLIVGSVEDILEGRLRSKMAPRSILASVYAFEIRYGVPVVWEADPQAAGRLVERWASWFARDLDRIAANITRNHHQEGESRN